MRTILLLHNTTQGGNPIERYIMPPRIKQTRRVTARSSTGGKTTYKQTGVTATTAKTTDTDGTDREAEASIFQLADGEDDIYDCNKIVENVKEDVLTLNDNLFAYANGVLSSDEVQERDTSNLLSQATFLTQETMDTTTTQLSLIKNKRITPEVTKSKLDSFVVDVCNAADGNIVLDKHRKLCPSKDNNANDNNANLRLPSNKFDMFRFIHILIKLSKNVKSDTVMSYRGLLYILNGEFSFNYNTIYNMVNTIATLVEVPVQALGISPNPRGRQFIPCDYFIIFLINV